MSRKGLNPSDADIERGHELRDASPRAVLIFAIVFIVSLVAVHAVAWRVLNYIRDQQNVSDRVDHPLHPLRELMSSTPPDPRLEPEPSRDVLPRQDLLDVQSREQGLLSNQGWIDGKHQFARIPLDEATKLAVDRGLPLTLPAMGAATEQSTPVASSTHGPGDVP